MLTFLVGTGTSLKCGRVKASFTSLNTLLIRLKKIFNVKHQQWLYIFSIKSHRKKEIRNTEVSNVSGMLDKPSPITL